MAMRNQALLVAMLALLGLAGCGGNDSVSSAATEGSSVMRAQLAAVAPEETRPQDARVFTLNEASLPFSALPGVQAETDRWWGKLAGSGYRIEVPKNWNGMLVLYAHGYNGDSLVLEVSDPPMRRHLIESGYAWAASSFSRNYYDVRAGVEDTNALALAFNAIAAQNNRPLPPPVKTYIVGASMGGHVAAAAVERETLATANNKVRYDGALPLCGVVGDTELFDYLNAYQLAAQYLAGVPATTFPVPDFPAIRKKITDELWYVFPAIPNGNGRRLENIVMNLTGGDRPIFRESFSIKPFQDRVWDRFGNDGTVEGILNKNGTDTTKIVYQMDSDPALSGEETVLNTSILRIMAAPDANRPRTDGLRWIPKVNGEFDVPVVTLHTLGDLFVPFKMEQVYRQRAAANGSDRWLVQRAIRSPGHCDITTSEQVAAFDALVTWEQQGIKPAGDDVLTPSVVADSRYGCAYTNDATGPEDPSALDVLRKLMPSCR